MKSRIYDKQFQAGLQAALVLTLVFLSACGSARRSEPIRGPLQLNEQLHRGQVVFMANCHKCHPGGEAGAAPAINNVPMTKGMLKFRVRSRAFFLGIGRMPSFKEHEISKSELEDLAQYIKALKKNGKRTSAQSR